MKKKLIALLFTVLLTFSGCGSMLLPTENTPTTDVMKDIKVNKDDSTVELTIPKDYMESATQKELDAAAADKVFSLSL